ncbi:hypothetical protein E2C01_035891 [Portunus trituberculatus]|uniref:Uncharacterized protein n=1 Tax=Portunus trituberculatus TaxID=210409 RepID=A0A5B7F763_PORTR|nr:hypothetical protein [Portunus trituberculatus]
MTLEVGQAGEGSVTEGALIGRGLRHAHRGRCLHVRLRGRGGCGR